MPATFQALGVLLLAILPGASYTFAYERVFGAFGLSLADRVLRFFAASAVFAAVSAGPALVAYRRFIVTGQLARGEINAVHFGLFALAYVLVPIAIGSLLGRAHRLGRPWAKLLLGDSPEPRAWDYVWRRGSDGLVRLKLKSGTWLGGLYATADGGERSWASGYPEAGDLYLSRRVIIDPDTGEFDRDTDDQVMVADGGGLLIQWAEIEYLEVQKYGG